MHCVKKKTESDRKAAEQAKEVVKCAEMEAQYKMKFNRIYESIKVVETRLEDDAKFYGVPPDNIDSIRWDNKSTAGYKQAKAGASYINNMLNGFRLLYAPWIPVIKKD